MISVDIEQEDAGDGFTVHVQVHGLRKGEAQMMAKRLDLEIRESLAYSSGVTGATCPYGILDETGAIIDPYPILFHR